MANRAKVWTFLFELLAFSTANIRENLANLVFHYYPSLLLDEKLEKMSNDKNAFEYADWGLCRCENLNCSTITVLGLFILD